MNDAFAEYDRHPPVPEVKAEATKKIEVSSDQLLCISACESAHLHWQQSEFIQSEGQYGTLSS